MNGNAVTGKKTFAQWCKSMRGQQIIVTITFLLVPLLLLFTFTYLPFLNMIRFSFYDMKYIGPRTFVGLQNYIDVFTRDDCFSALGLSLYYMVGSVVQMALALLFATILSFKVKGSKFFRGALYFPCLICGISVGFIFKFFFTHGFVFDTLLSWVGFNVETLPYWLKDESINNLVLVGCSVWKYIGQNIVLFIGAIASVDTALYEAADIDGANAWQKFRSIILPSIRTIVVLNLILSISGALSAFEMPYVTTGGGFGTSTYFVVMDKLAHTNQKVGLASAMAVILLVIIMLVTFLQKWVASLMDDGNDSMSRKAYKAYRKAEKERKRQQKAQAKAESRLAGKEAAV
ncbi:carbohydrate ABC transporter permease [Allofournierella massiliensis]|uniref:Sugar ABC transporter permease n=1 Tax=Allofournierella massiliensis TaxID=1650663 RepID=A0ABT7UQ15_9FIRM|nr:sugar ABC transporter permease [Fournierella massiliensis]MDM8200982.1 sugar ABC transporter permease [Fournierella massiliensis]